jgi:hypothetical protein
MKYKVPIFIKRRKRRKKRRIINESIELKDYSMTNANESSSPIIPPRKLYKLYAIRVYAIDGAYSSEMIDEFEFKLNNTKTESKLQELIEEIGKNGHTIQTPSGGKLYYPPHRIYYVEAVEMNN